jgi:hypothetical protein
MTIFFFVFNVPSRIILIAALHSVSCSDIASYRRLVDTHSLHHRPQGAKNFRTPEVDDDVNVYVFFYFLIC